MKLVLFGDPYYIRTIIRCAKYVYHNCSNIYISDIKIADGIIDDSEVKIDLLNAKTIDEIQADELLIIRNDNIEHFIPRCITNCKISQRSINIKKIPTPTYPCKVFETSLLKNKPTILSLAIGKGAQQYYSELLIHKHLTKREINFYQHFSSETLFVLSNQNFNLSCKKLYSDIRTNYDIFVGGIAIDSTSVLLDLNSSPSKTIYRMQPDAAIISCCNSPHFIENDIKLAVNILRYRFRIKKIIILISEYYCNESAYTPMKTEYYKEYSWNENRYISSIDLYQEEKIIDELIAPTYLPNGIVPII
jgi:hypothetical protein